MAFKIACFSKNRPDSGGKASRPPKPPAARDSAHGPPSMMRSSYASLLAHVSQFRNFPFLTLVNHTTASGLLQRYFYPTKSSSFEDF